MKIFDFHLHPGYDFHKEALAPEVFFGELRAYGITRCAGSATHKADSNQALEAYAEILPRLNREAYEWQERYPDSFTAGIHIHPDFIDLSCKEVEYYAAHGVRLVGELVPYLMGWRNYNDPRLWEILEVVQAKDMVLNFHPNKRPEDMEAMIRQVPNLKIVIAHLDGYGLYDFAIEMMQKYENVYFDISAHGAERAGMLQDAVARVGADRILFGTDFPGYSPESFVQAVLSADISDDDKERIFYKNAEQLLGVKMS